MKNTQLHFWLRIFNRTILLLSICFLLSCTGKWGTDTPPGDGDPDTTSEGTQSGTDTSYTVSCVCVDDNENSSTIDADSVKKAEADCTAKAGYNLKKCDKTPL